MRMKGKYGNLLPLARCLEANTSLFYYKTLYQSHILKYAYFNTLSCIYGSEEGAHVEGELWIVM